MPQLSQSLRLDLADTFASDCKMLSDLLERMFGTGVPETEPHLDHLFLAGR